MFETGVIELHDLEQICTFLERFVSYDSNFPLKNSIYYNLNSYEVIPTKR